MRERELRLVTNVTSVTTGVAARLMRVEVADRRSELVLFVRNLRYPAHTGATSGFSSCSAPFRRIRLISFEGSVTLNH